VAPAIIRWSLRRPHAVVFAWLCFVVLGGVYASGVKLDIFPPIAPAETVIQTEAPGLAPDQVAQLVTTPIEDLILGAPGIAAVRSESIQGLSVITVDVAPRADPALAQQTVIGRLARLSGGGLPAGVGQPRVEPLTSATGELLKVGFTSDRLTPMQLRSLIQWTVRPRLLSTPGVARVAVYGGQVRRIEVRARPGDLSDSDLGLLDVVRAVQRATSVAGAGFIDTPVQRVLITPHGQALTPEDVAAGQIQVSNGAPTRIGDVSDVVEAAAPAVGDALVMGKPAVLVAISAQYGANTVEQTRAVEKVLTSLEPSLTAQGVRVTRGLYRPAGVIADALRSTETDLVIGAGLAFLLLLVVLRDPRAALISFLTIPLSLLAAVVALRAFGMSLNTMTLGGLVLALGVVIDDAVIDVENIVSRLRDAERRHASHAQAVLRASLEVRAPVLYGTLVIAVAFAPMLALPGASGALLGPLALAAIFACIASLLMAVSVTPALALLLLGHIGPGQEHPPVRRLKSSYRRWLGRSCDAPRWPVWTSLAAIVLAGTVLFLFRREGLPELHSGHVTLRVAAPASTSLEAMRDYGRRIGADLLSLPGVSSVAQVIGRDETDARAAGIEESRFDIGLKRSASVSAQDRAAAAIRRRLQDFAGLQGSVSEGLGSSLSAEAPSSAPFSVAVRGSELAAVDAVADQVAAVLRALPGAGEVRTPDRSTAAAIRVDLDFRRLALYGLSAADVLDTVQTAFEGQRAARIYEQGRTVDLAVTAQSGLRDDPEAVGELLLRSSSGISTPLKKVAAVRLDETRTSIRHEGGQLRELVSATPRDPRRFASLAAAEIGRRISLPPGVYLEYAGVGSVGGAARRALAFNAALAGLAGIALLLLAFGNARSVALILASALFALVGGVAAVVLMGGELSLGALVGFVAALGLATRNAILLIARVGDMVADGEPWALETVLDAAQERLVPILVASLLIALAVAPLLLFGDAPGSEILRPMAAVVLGGVISSAAFGLLVLPILIFHAWRPGPERGEHQPAA
jgi:CzcA family heavy metal efflux pump